MEISAYKPYGDPEFESLIERIHPPRFNAFSILPCIYMVITVLIMYWFVHQFNEYITYVFIYIIIAKQLLLKTHYHLNLSLNHSKLK